MKLRNMGRILLATMFVFVGVSVLCNNVKAVDTVDNFPSEIMGNINSNQGAYHVLNYDGNRNLFAKIYSSSSPKSSGKAFCSAFTKQAPGWYPALKAHSCKVTNFSSNGETDKRVAASIGAMIKKARDLQGSTNISWDKYYYLELAINKFLYSGYSGEKGFGIAENNIGTVSAATTKKINEYLNAGNYQYNNFKKTKVEFVSTKYVGNTVEATIKCTDYAKANKSCSLTASATVTVDGTNHPVTPKISGNKLTIDLDPIIGSLSGDSNHTIKTDIKVNDKVTYYIAENYNCGKNSAGASLQSLIPNMLKEESYTVSATKSISKTVMGTGSLKIKKFNSDTGAFLEGTVVEIYQNDNLILTETITSENGLEIENLGFAKYCIKEVSNKSGYKLHKYTVDGVDTNSGENGVCVDLKDGKANADISVYNKKDVTKLTVKKVDALGKSVSGAALRVFYLETTDLETADNSDIKVVDVASWITDGNDKIIEVEVGKTYMVVEDTPPENYTSVVNLVEITAHSDASKNVVTLKNVYSSFKISKQDITNKKELPGAKLEIRDERGFLMASWVSTDKPQEITGLDDGNYTLTETTAPNGYSISETISFTIENGKLKDDADNVLVMYDKLIVKVPDTFSTNYIITMLIGLIMVVSGIGVLVYEFKKKKTA